MMLASRVMAIVCSFGVLSAACDDPPVASSPSPTPSVLTSLMPSPSATCSASSYDALATQPGLPAAVADMRQKIIGAAVTCDYARLETLAGRGRQPFTYSFGHEGQFGRFLKRQEGEGLDPLSSMIQLLDSRYNTIDTAGKMQYVWPSAFAFQSWNEVPSVDRQALKPLYGAKDFAFFDRFGAYIGLRVGISDSGEWLYFVAGD